VGERQSVWQGTFRLFGVDMKCHVLDDGTRIIEADSVRQLFEAMGSGADIGVEAEEFARWKRDL
jgi:hypothetical protein